MIRSEIYDVIDENDHVISEASKDECHTNPALAHRVVHFTLFDPMARLVLISRRALAKAYDAGQLSFVGEHVKAGESYDEALLRGAGEELGMTAGTFHRAGEHVFRESGFTERVRMFLIESSKNHQLRPDPGEIAEIEWVTPERLATLTVSAMTRYWIEQVNWNEFFDQSKPGVR